MRTDKQCEAEALSVWRSHGEGAPRFAAERVKLAAMRDDMAGIKHWQSIAAVLATLMNGGPKRG